MKVVDTPIPTGLLSRALEPLLTQDGRGGRIVSLERAPAPRRSSWWLEVLRLGLDDGTTRDLVFKDLGRPTPGSSADRIKPGRVVDPGREPWVYRCILEPLGSGAPSLVGSVPGPEPGRHWLFLERIRGEPLQEEGRWEVWKGAAAWLARFHLASGARTVRSGPLLRHDAELHRWWFRRALALAADAEEAAEAERREDRTRRVRSLERAHARAVEVVTALPRTVVHGEFYPSNVLVEGARIRPVDWEMAGLGPALLDLAALTVGSWDREQRTALAMAYRAAVLEAGASVPPLDHFLRALVMCRLLLAVQWLGWGRGWEPPREHRHGWLDEAVHCAEAVEAA